MEKPAVLEVSNLSKSFNNKQIVNNISFAVETGDVFGFLGPNGAGKTTTIRMILNLVQPDKGTVKINGHNLEDSYSKAISKVGAIVETPQFYNYLSGYQNLLLVANLHPQVSKNKIAEVLEIVGLTRQ